MLILTCSRKRKGTGIRNWKKPPTNQVKNSKKPHITFYSWLGNKMADEIQGKLKFKSDEYVKKNYLFFQLRQALNWKLTLKHDLEIMRTLWKHWFNVQEQPKKEIKYLELLRCNRGTHHQATAWFHKAPKSYRLHAFMFHKNKTEQKRER